MKQSDRKVSLGNLNSCDILIHNLLFLSVGKVMFSWYEVVLCVKAIYEASTNIFSNLPS